MTITIKVKYLVIAGAVLFALFIYPTGYEKHTIKVIHNGKLHDTYKRFVMNRIDHNICIEQDYIIRHENENSYRKVINCDYVPESPYLIIAQPLILVLIAVIPIYIFMLLKGKCVEIYDSRLSEWNIYLSSDSPQVRGWSSQPKPFLWWLRRPPNRKP